MSAEDYYDSLQWLYGGSGLAEGASAVVLNVASTDVCRYAIEAQREELSHDVTRRTLLAGAGAALAAPAIVTSARAQTPAVTLKLHHFLPPVSNGHAKMLAPWAKKVEADSQGKIKIDIFPSMQLGGTPPQLYDQARDGVVDIVWTLPGSTPGRFPTTEVMELPFIGAAARHRQRAGRAGVRRRAPQGRGQGRQAAVLLGARRRPHPCQPGRSRPWRT